MYSTSPQNANCAQMCSKLVCILSSKYVQNLCLTQRNLQFVQKFGGGQSLCRQQCWPGRSLKLPKKTGRGVAAALFSANTLGKLHNNESHWNARNWFANCTLEKCKMPSIAQLVLDCWWLAKKPETVQTMQWYSLHQVQCNLNLKTTKKCIESSALPTVQFKSAKKLTTTTTSL